MAKGKKYKKWFEKHREEIQQNGGSRKKEPPYRGFFNMPVEVVETGELCKTSTEDQPLVHGSMYYECESCKAIYEMYLEKGLEDPLQDKYYPDQHKPVPFIIGCKCGGMCNHTKWGMGKKYENYQPLPEDASYFKNDPKEDCGRSVLKEPVSYSWEDCKLKLQLLEDRYNRNKKRGY